MNAKLSRLLFLLPALLSLQTQAQSPGEYPVRPITVIVSTAAGSAGDILMRSIAPRLAERLKQSVIVENKVGASGTIGADYVAKAAPEGYALLATVNTLAILPALRTDLPYDLLKDFAHITKLVKVDLTFGLSTSVKANDLKELVALIKATPGKYTFGSPGNGTPHHMAGEVIRQNLGLDMVHVPHKDLALAVQNLVGGHVDMLVSGTASILPAAKTGKVKLLATTGTSRSAFAPDIPTFRELGYDFMDDVAGWYALSAPAKTPAPVIGRLNREFREVLAIAAVKEALEKIGMEAETSTPEQANAFVKGDIERWTRVVKQGKISAN